MMGGRRSGSCRHACWSGRKRLKTELRLRPISPACGCLIQVENPMEQSNYAYAQHKDLKEQGWLS
jgi:hypothetical protein